MEIKVYKSGTGAHCAEFQDSYGNMRKVFTLNGEAAARRAALNRMGEDLSKPYVKPFIKISDILKFGKLLMKRRAKNIEARESIRKNRK